MSHEEFVAKVKQWRAGGAPCPAETGKKTASIGTAAEGMEHGLRQR
jgi:hypothetical protein